MAAENGEPFQGIDSYEAAVGKTIIKVKAKCKNGQHAIFPVIQTGTVHEHGFVKQLYFVYEGGALIVNQNTDFWTDSTIPVDGLIDVSDIFGDVIGHSISDFQYQLLRMRNARRKYMRLMSTINLDSGKKITFSINSGEIEDDEQIAFFDIDGVLK